MPDTGSEQTLAALLALDAEGSQPSGGRTQTALPLPSVDKRVDMFLRAVHGPERSFAAEERDVARARILDEMAADLIDQVRSNEPDPATSPRDSALAVAGGPPALRSTSFIATWYAPLARLVAQVRADLIYSGSAMSGARLAAASVGALGVLVVAWTGVWLYALWSVQTTIAAWTDWEAKAGRSYACASKAIGGYPFRVEVRCTAPQATMLAEQVDAKAAELRMVANVLRSGLVTAELTGPISITKAGAAYVANWSLARTDIRGSASRLDEISIVMEGFRFDRVTDRGSERMFDSARTVVDLRVAARSNSPDRDVDLAVSIAQGSAPFGAEAFDAEVNAILRDVNVAGPQRWPAQVREWQTGGGSVAVNYVRIQQRDSAMVGQGTLGLDGDGQVAGDLRMTATAASFERLARSLFGDNERIRAAQALVQLEARSATRTPGKVGPREGRTTPDEITIPITFVNGAILLRSILLGQLPSLY